MRFQTVLDCTSHDYSTTVRRRKLEHVRGFLAQRGERVRERSEIQQHVAQAARWFANDDDPPRIGQARLGAN